MKIYTKTGDKGTTSLIGGTRVPKYHEKIEAYGTVDELNSFTGLIRDKDIDEHSKEVLFEIQNVLFVLGGLLAKDDSKETKDLPGLKESDVAFLESEIDEMNKHLPSLKSFVLPGGHPTVSLCHIARTVCRRAERLVIKLSLDYDVNPLEIKYLNRLSDYFFVLARKFSYDAGVPENLWKPRV
jgi:cob(I)alamin adenosyltransferase